jgi:hypothetical protein
MWLMSHKAQVMTGMKAKLQIGSMSSENKSCLLSGLFNPN